MTLHPFKIRWNKLTVSKLLATAAAVFFLASLPMKSFAGGPKYIAGVSYFNPAVLGRPVVWVNGQVNYYVDQGSLNSAVSNGQATAMVDAAAAIWSAVPTAAVTLTDQGNLAEDVNGSNVQAVSGAFAYPSDVTPSATTTAVAVIFDADGSVIDALYGVGASIPTNCTQNGVFVWIDNINPNATLAHGVIVMNGRCATTSGLQTMMQYELERAFGRILGLDFSQVNDVTESPSAAQGSGILGWPVMEPLDGECGPNGGSCIPSPNTLRLDDVAALNRLYPVTTSNQGNFRGKALTAANTISIQGTVSFRDGTGMQGVNVVARPLDSNGNPLYQYTVTFVSGSYFAGNHGNPITGWLDAQGNRLDRFGSNVASQQGFFDLSGIPLPAGVSVANYQVSFEAVDPLYIDDISVGPYIQGSPTPSGTLSSLTLSGLQAGNAQTVNVLVGDSASGASRKKVLAASGTELSGMNSGRSENQTSEDHDQAVKSVRPVSIGTVIQPSPLPETGAWTGRLGQIEASDWFILPVRGNRIFTVVTQALNETGTPSSTKAMPALGVWDGFDPVGTAAPGWTSAANGIAPGETWLQVATSGKDIVRLGISDQRGDGRPDYTYRGWVLYADTVYPSRLPASGGQIVIRGTGFRNGDTVKVGGVAATVTSILPAEITAAVAASKLMTGSVDVEVDDLPGFNALAVIPGGISFDSANSDALNLVSAPSNQIPLNVPQPFSVIALGSDGNPAAGVTVAYSVTTGVAGLGCSQSVCQVTTTGDGRATLPVTATNTSIAVVTASLTNGASLQAHFFGGTPAVLTALTPTLYFAAGATASWPVQALAQSAGVPAPGRQISWQSGTGLTAPPGAVTTNTSGIATTNLTVGPLTEGQTAVSYACFTGTSSCVSFYAFGARPEFASLTAISGTSQSMPAGANVTPASIAMRVLDMNGHPMGGATVTVSQELYSWTQPCPRHGRCASAQLLLTGSTTLTSALDGTITISPLTLPGVATSLVGLAATGNSGSLSFTVEQHP